MTHTKLSAEELAMLGFGTQTTIVEDVNGIEHQEGVVYNNPDMLEHVGMFGKIGSKYGLIDSVHGDKYGFVSSNGDSWESELVSSDNMQFCASKEDESIARKSAKGYISNETESLTRRMAHPRNEQELSKIKRMLNVLKYWASVI